MTAPRLTELALFTSDVPGVTAFYERVLGVAPAERSDGHAVFVLGELVLRIHAAVEPGPGDPPADDHVPSPSRASTSTPPRWPRRASRWTGRATSRGAAPPTCATPTAASSS